MSEDYTYEPLPGPCELYANNLGMLLHFCPWFYDYIMANPTLAPLIEGPLPSTPETPEGAVVDTKA